MYYVKCNGKTLGELKLAVEKVYKELSGKSEITERAVKIERSVTPTIINEDDGEEYEEVESPYAASSPAESAAAFDRFAVIDNEVDSEGIPWDSRIHASSKAVVKDGTWRTKRGADDAEVAQVKAELRARVMSAIGGATQAPEPIYVAPAIHAAPVQQAPVVQAPVVVQQAPALPPMMKPVSGHTLDTFRSNFPLVIASLISEGKLTQDYVNSLCAHFGVVQIWMINEQQQAEVFASFVEHGLVQQVG